MLLNHHYHHRRRLSPSSSLSYSKIPTLPLPTSLNFQKIPTISCSISKVHNYATVDYERRPSVKWNAIYRKISLSDDPNVHSADVLNQWEKEDRKLSEWELCRVVKELRKYKRYDKALEVYDWMSNRGERFRISISDSAIQLDLIAKVRGVASAENYFLSLPDALKDRRIYGALLNAYVRARMREKAESLVEKMRSKGHALQAQPPANQRIHHTTTTTQPPPTESTENVAERYAASNGNDENEIVWEADEIETISSLFKGRIPQKPPSRNSKNTLKQRPLPLPLPHKLRPLRLPNNPRPPTRKHASSDQLYKNPNALVGLARDIRNLKQHDDDVGRILKKWVHILRKGSLSMTVRELGHMGLPDRALQTFSWAQKQPHLFPDDRLLASTVEVLARNHDLKLPFNLERFASVASRGVIEAMARGFIKGGSLHLAWKLVMIAKNSRRKLDPGLYAKLIIELGKNPDKDRLVVTLLDELGERDDLELSQQDCSGVMKVCIRLGKFELVESVYDWFRQSGHDPSVVMYTTVIHSRYSEKKFREALAVVWEMEGSNCLFDFPAYRVAIRLFVALNDLQRTVRYFSKLKEAGFSPTYDVYRDLMKMYIVSGRLAKCKEVCKELELAGFKLDKETMSQLLQLEREKRLGF